MANSSWANYSATIASGKIKVLTGAEIAITGCGRTDTGVHARNYFAHFDLEDELVSKLKIRSLNAILPEDIAVQNIFQTTDDFHARFDAISRSYVYRLQLVKDPFQLAECYFLKNAQN